MWLNDTTDTCVTKTFDGSSTTSLLSSFHSLEELHFKTISQMCPEYDNRPQKPAKSFMQSLVKRSRKLIHLQKITLNTTVEDGNLDAFTNFSLDFNSIPGWVHSGKYESYVDWKSCNVVEVLQRVHEPWWPQDSKKRRGNGEAEDDMLEESQGFFSTGGVQCT